LPLWIVLTLVAVLIQSVRTVLQRNQVERLSVVGATYARFLYGAPLAWLMMVGAFKARGVALPTPPPEFFAYVIGGGLMQVLGNALFVHLSRSGNFTVVTTYAKTETVFGALLSFILLGDILSLGGLGGVVVTFAGVVVLAAGREALTLSTLAAAAGSRTVFAGVGVGALHAVGSTSYRGAILSLGLEDGLLAALFTLAWVSVTQAVTMSAWIAVRAPAVLRTVLKGWRVAFWIGVTGVGASIFWYSAFALQITAYVLAMAQAEVIVAFLWSHYHFKERVRWGEVAGMVVTLAGIGLVVFSG